MKNIFKKIIAFILSVLMSFALLPAVTIQASAADPTPLPIYITGSTTNFTGLVSDNSGTTLLCKTGNTVVNPSGYLQLTNSSGSLSGTVVRRSPIQLDRGFSTYFVANMSDFGSAAGDGLCFIMYDSSNGIQYGASGINLGYSDYDKSGNIITGDSLAVELDTYCNYGEELNGSGIYTTAYPHVAVDTNDWNGSRPGSTADPRYSASYPGANILHSGYENSTSTTYSSPTDDGTNRKAHQLALSSGSDIHVWVDYFGNSDGTTSEVVVTYGTSSTRTDSSNHTFKRQLPNQNLLGDSVYVGFSASTGGAYEKHTVKAWYFSNSPAAGGIDPASGSYTQAVSTVSVSPSSTVNPSSATVILYNTSGSAMSGTADIYVDGIRKETGVSVAAAGYDYSIPSGLSSGSHKVQAVATGGASDDAGFSVSSPAVSLGSATLSSDSKYYYENATVTGDNIRTVLISFSDNVTSGDTITLPAAAGFTVSGTSNAYTKRINIPDGTLASAIQDYLRGVGFAIASSTQTVNVTVSTENIKTDTFYNIDTQHYYQFIAAGSSGITWTDAYDAAQEKTYMGRTGYLATVTSKDEDIYLNSLSGGSTGWLGGTILTNSGIRVDAENNPASNGLYYSGFNPASFVSDGWHWACGPEIGDIFYNKTSLKSLSVSDADTANTALSYYFNWGRGDEPNNTAGGENCLTTLVVSGQDGKQGTSFSWNDISYNNIDLSSTYSAKGYFVEYGNAPTGDSSSGSTAFASASGTLSATYSVSLNTNGGTVNSGSITSYTYGIGASLPTDVTKDGSIFVGWCTNSALTSSAVTAISPTDTGAKEYWAKWIEATYAATVITRVDGAAANMTSVELKSGSTTLTASPTSTGVYTADAANGTYSIYVNSSDTCVPITIIGGAGSATVDYYTVNFSASDAGAASGSTVSATAGGSSITSGAAVLSGAAVVITAAGAGADSYTYLWSGAGTSGETTAALTKSSLGGTVDAICTVTGSQTSSSGHSSPPSRTITVTETSSSLFSGNGGVIRAEANMINAFSNSVEVKVTNTDQKGSSFGFGDGTRVYPFDISLYIKGTNTKTEPSAGYAVTITLPIPRELLDVKDRLFITHKSDNGTVTTLKSGLKQINGVWSLEFEATKFSPYALVVTDPSSTDTAAGLPYYLKDGGKVFIGFAADGKYLAPDGATVLFTPNPKNFTDISTHWGKAHIDFVTEREVFMGTAPVIFSPDTGMTRAMFATVIGRLYERSYGEISVSDAHAFTDCNYNDYYGKFVDWAAENNIIQGVGGGIFQPDRQVTRQEMSVMLRRFAEFMKLSASTSTGAALNYSDASSIAAWAKDAALYCQETGIITGRDGGNFAPTETASRAEVAAITQRFVKLVLK